LKKNIDGRGLADTLDLVPIAGYWGKVYSKIITLLSKKGKKS